MFKRFWIFSVIALAVSTATGVYAGMFGFLKNYDVQLFPPVEGRLLHSGVPLEGVEIIREATYDEVKTETVVTDDDGRFFFPEWVTRSNTPGKPLIEVRLRQVVAAKYQGEYYILWQYTTDQIEPESVITELLSNLDCDITNEEIDHYFPIPDNPDFEHIIGSICRWETKS
ncbi:DUF6795 domain-containing protein [Marinobacter salexigens]|uniref:DUF6795 domain-containing protein n=1 Tax=Marinobacter salexigens TaxID=1925763 RepID=A0ABS6A588_9GAMM|nr:DUF6795 domain-containing protein [Marinobacter salexigens]MBU2873136.1 hypothetical protein [Marinobacter salexigens]